MKKAIFFLLLICLSANDVTAQRKKLKRAYWTFGMQTGNLFTLAPAISVNQNFTNKGLLRSNAGFVARRVINRLPPNMRWGFGTAKSGVLAIDFGINAVWAGYHYRFGEVLGTTDQINWEVPIHLVLYDRQNVFIPRKWRRKGITTFARFGPKLGYLPERAIEKTVSQGKGSVRESVQIGGLNFLWSNGGGIIKNYPNGNSVLIELSWTQGFIPVAKGELNYSDGTTLNPINQPLSWNGSYLSLNTVFLFHPKNWKYLPKGKGKLEKVIFNPRYI